MDAAFAQLSVLGSSLVLLCAFALLWRRRSAAHVAAFTIQSLVLAATTAMVAHFTLDWQLSLVAAMIFALKGAGIPILLTRMDRRFGAEGELQPYVNTGTSLLVGGLLVLLAYVVTRPLVTVSQLPTRAGLPLAMGVIFVSLFV